MYLQAKYKSILRDSTYNILSLTSILPQVSEETVEFVLILDRSGSMGGQPWAQVQTAAAQMVEIVRGKPRIKTKIMVYNGSAQFLKSTGESAAIEVKTIR